MLPSFFRVLFTFCGPQKAGLLTVVVVAASAVAFTGAQLASQQGGVFVCLCVFAYAVFGRGECDGKAVPYVPFPIPGLAMQHKKKTRRKTQVDAGLVGWLLFVEPLHVDFEHTLANENKP